MKDMLKGQVAFVTGGNSGMGESTAKMFAAEGAIVVVGGRNPKKCQRVVDEIVAAGGEARFYCSLDVGKKETIKENVDAIIAEFGKIDILAAFAGMSYDNEALDMTDDEKYAANININMTGTYHTVFEVLPYMKKARSGKIILCSSNGAFNPTTPAYSYHMAKAGCESLTVNLATEVAPLGIRVNCIVPGPIVTPFWDELLPAGPERDGLFQGISMTEVPLNRMGTGDDIAGVALFFASELSSYVTGLRMFVGGGMGYVYSHGQSFLLQAKPPEVD